MAKPDLKALLADRQTHAGVGELTAAEKIYRDKRRSFAQGKAQQAMASLHPDEYRSLYLQAMDLYDELHGGAK